MYLTTASNIFESHITVKHPKKDKKREMPAVIANTRPG